MRIRPSIPAAAPGARREPLPSGAAAETRQNQPRLGILYMVLSTVGFAGVNAVVKWEVAIYPVGEVAFYRSLFALVAVAVAILPRTGVGVLRTNRPRAHLLRGVAQFGSMTSMFMAFSLMPLGSAVAVGFAAPLFTTLMAIVVLKEQVGPHRWSALVVGFIGVVVMAHPGAGTVQPGALFALANAVLISTVAIGIRQMSTTESPETLTLYQMAIITVCTLALLPFGFRHPAWRDIIVLAIAGAGNGVAQIWWTRSLSLAPPSAVVPFNYLSLVWAMMLGFAIWGDVPGPDLIAGAVIVVGSGLYILWRETLRHGVRRPMPSPPSPGSVRRAPG